MTKRNKTDSEGKEAPRSSFTFVAPGDDSLVPILAAGGKNSITPPSRGGDKTSRDRDRYRDRQKGKLKGKIGDIIGDNPIITRPGKINVPVPTLITFRLLRISELPLLRVPKISPFSDRVPSPTPMTALVVLSLSAMMRKSVIPRTELFPAKFRSTPVALVD